EGTNRVGHPAHGPSTWNATRGPHHSLLGRYRGAAVPQGGNVLDRGCSYPGEAVPHRAGGRARSAPAGTRAAARAARSHPRARLELQATSDRQRSARTATRTASAASTSTAAAAVDRPRPSIDWNSEYTSRGSVWVRPSMFPANMMVAPNSPNARAQASTRPAASAAFASGTVTERKTAHSPAPSARAASSRSRFVSRNPARAARTKRGAETKVWATTTARVVNGISTPTASNAGPIAP